MTTKDREHRTQSIALIGMRGCGKTVVGRALAALLGVHHVDTDDLIEQEAGKTIAEIFAAEGEAGFRDRERAVVQQIPAEKPVVISVGGGAVLDDGNVQWLRSMATVIWLRAEADVLCQRVSRDANTPQSRPPLTNRSGLEEIRRLLTERSLLYKKACSITVDTTHKTPEQIAQEILLLC